MERILRLPDKTIIGDKVSIDEFLGRRRTAQSERIKNSPTIVLNDINLEKASLSPTTRNIEGTIEIEYGDGRPFKNDLYEIPDLLVELTPGSGSDEYITPSGQKVQLETPRKVMHYDLTEGERKITIDVLFDETAPEYWKHYGDKETTDALVRNNLLEALKAKNWTRDRDGAWSATK
jgi:hypothetical protein